MWVTELDVEEDVKVPEQPGFGGVPSTQGGTHTTSHIGCWCGPVDIWLEGADVRQRWGKDIGATGEDRKTVDARSST